LAVSWQQSEPLVQLKLGALSKKKVGRIEMKIDARVETIVRKALTGVIQRDNDKFASAIASFPDDDAVAEGIRLAVALALFVLLDQYGRTPTDTEIRAVSEKVVEMEDWTDVTTDEVFDVIVAAFNHVAADQVLPMQRVIIVPYVTAGNLVSSCHKEGEEWWDYLDRVETAIEASPDPS
jgi:hypothetical protein